MSTGGLRHVVATLQRGEGGGIGIRTLGTLSSTTVFKTVPLNRSGIPPVKTALCALGRNRTYIASSASLRPIH